MIPQNGVYPVFCFQTSQYMLKIIEFDCTMINQISGKDNKIRVLFVDQIY